jgi:hypothetical protein
MIVLDVTIVVVVQPAIQDGLHASFSTCSGRSTRTRRPSPRC